MLEFRLLGPLEVLADGRPITLGGPKQRATLAILLLHSNHVVSVDRLADDLYAGAPPVTAVTQVQRQISDLRKTLGAGAAIETRPPGYLLRVGSEQVDLHRFERLAEEGRHAHDPSLDLKAGVEVGRGQPSGPMLVLPRQEERMDELLAIAVALAKTLRRELLIVRLLTDNADLSSAAARLGAHSASLDVSARS